MSISNDDAINESPHAASIAALRSATALRYAKASLLFAITGTLVCLVLIAMFSSRRVMLFGMAFGDVSLSELDIPEIRAMLARIEESVDSANRFEPSLENLSSRIGRVDDDVRRLIHASEWDWNPFSVCHEPTNPSSAPRFTSVEIDPIGYDVLGVATVFGTRRFGVTDLNAPRELLQATPTRLSEIAFRLTWMSETDEKLQESTVRFTKVAGRWDVRSRRAAVSGKNETGSGDAIRIDVAH